MSAPILLDASALLAYLQGEPGGDRVQSAMLETGCAMTAANLTEVISRALDRGVAEQALQRILDDIPVAILPLTAEDGVRAGWLRTPTRSKGLSLGDRLCLAVAQRTQSTVLTADRPWLDLAALLGIDIVGIRPDTH
ncbi:type II toxin-antitoxin system VapC family toxin [Methyloversatilis sp.]|uniref:type II toxin-antitoxin system VapC family toxin n=1 Tax=Methyloversatilis sp. TaxID=2569862 RepID=UPI0035AFD1CC